MGSEYRVAYPTHTKEHFKARSGNVTQLWGLHLPRKACVTKENEQKDFVPKAYFPLSEKLSREEILSREPQSEHALLT